MAKYVAKRIKVEMFFDIISPYAYIQLELFRRNHINWPTMYLRLKPFFLSAVLAGSKNNPPFACEKKGNYILQDLRMLANTYKIPLIIPEDFFMKPIAKVSLSVQRFLVTIQPNLTTEFFEALVLYIYQKHFSSGSVDLMNADVIFKLAIESGVDSKIAKAAIETMNESEAKNSLRINTEQALKAGAFGAPTTFIHTADNGPKMIWGSDRMFVIGQLLGELSPPIILKE